MKKQFSIEKIVLFLKIKNSILRKHHLVIFSHFHLFLKAI